MLLAGHVGVGKTWFITMLWRWLLDKGYSEVTERDGISYLTATWALIQQRQYEPTMKTAQHRILIHINTQKIPKVKSRKFTISTEDIAGEHYEKTTSEFINLAKEADGLIIMFELVNKELPFPEQVSMACKLFETFDAQGIRMRQGFISSSKPVAFIVSKIDTLPPHLRDMDLLSEEFEYTAKPLLKLLGGQRVSHGLFPVSAVGDLYRAPPPGQPTRLEPEGFMPLISFLAKKLP